MSNLFGDALANLGRMSLNKFLGFDPSQIVDAREHAASSVVLNSLNDAVQIVNQAHTELKDLFEALNEHDVRFYPQFSPAEALSQVESKSNLFWKHVTYVTDGLNRGNDPQYMMEFVETRVAPAMNYVINEIQKLIHNFKAPSLISGTWPEIEKMMSFALAASSQGGEEVKILIEQMSEISTDLNLLKDELLEQWDPSGDDSFDDWCFKYNTKYQLLIARHKALVSTLSQPVSTDAAVDAFSAIDQIKKLGELLDLGLITPTEFSEKKEKLLGQI